MSATFLPIPTELLSQIEFLAKWYLDAPTMKKEEDMLILLAGVIKRHCDCIFTSQSDPEDLIQVASIASTMALRTYNPAKGSFYRWSRRVMYQQMRNHLRDEGVLIKIPRNLLGKVRIEYVSWEQLEASEDSEEWND
jgi:DNA-directed RNA polymerase specialized sigma subunit